jgi:GH43 family beta-xylosidase
MIRFARMPGLLLALMLCSMSLAQESAPRTFTNPVYRGADPWVVKHEGHYYLCRSGPGHTIEVWKSSRLTDRGERRTVWKAPATGWNRAEVWAPELHHISGRWYIYYAASTGRNADHRMGVLESAGDDPLGPYLDRGQLYTGDDIAGRTSNRWAIDGTVLQLERNLYFIWSGWETTEDVQYLYIARMENPWTIGGNRVKLCDNATYAWERVGENPKQRGLHEGPTAIVRNGRIFLFYSCSGSWEPTYKTGLLHADAKADPLDPASWTKHPQPVFTGAGRTLGAGHASFTTSPDGTEDWIVYHTKTRPQHGWDDRVIHMQPFTWGADGFPRFGEAAQPGEPLPVPSGERP